MHTYIARNIVERRRMKWRDIRSGGMQNILNLFVLERREGVHLCTLGEDVYYYDLPISLFTVWQTYNYKLLVKWRVNGERMCEWW